MVKTIATFIRMCQIHVFLKANAIPDLESFSLRKSCLFFFIWIIYSATFWTCFSRSYFPGGKERGLIFFDICKYNSTYENIFLPLKVQNWLICFKTYLLITKNCMHILENLEYMDIPIKLNKNSMLTIWWISFHMFFVLQFTHMSIHAPKWDQLVKLRKHT